MGAAGKSSEEGGQQRKTLNRVESRGDLRTGQTAKGTQEQGGQHRGGQEQGGQHRGVKNWVDSIGGSRTG